MKPKTLELIDKIADYEAVISNAMYGKEKAEEVLEDMLNPFKINGLRSFIAKKIMANMDDSYIEKIMKDRNDELDNFTTCTSMSTGEYPTTLHSVSYKLSNVFDPEHDEFKIMSYNFNEDGTKVKINVECIKNRQYLGITGSWIPCVFSTIWFDKEDLYKFDK